MYQEYIEQAEVVELGRDGKDLKGACKVEHFRAVEDKDTDVSFHVSFWTFISTRSESKCAEASNAKVVGLVLAKKAIHDFFGMAILLKNRRDKMASILHRRDCPAKNFAAHGLRIRM